MMNWDDMKIFLAIAQAKGLKKAAEKLDIHHTSCARRIKVLEQELGTRLFDRLPSGYALTQAGEKLLFSAQNIQDEFSEIEGSLLGKDTRLEGNIRVTIPNGFATHLLMPDLTAFMELYPDVQVEINMTYGYSDLANREADVAIRHADNPPESLAGKRVGRLYFSAYASTKYLKTHDPLNNPEQCRWLGWGVETNHLKWAQKKKYPTIPVRGNLYSDVLQLSAITEGMGIASLPCFIGDKAPGIERIPGAETEARDWLWILAHKDMATNAKVRAFMDFMNAAFARHEKALKGEI
ncbi:MAG: LysR family transcriptional regulator [Halopseudomonas aestusnigri]